MESYVIEKITNKIIKMIKQEEKNIKKMNEIDANHYKMRIDINRLEELTQKLQNIKAEKNVSKNIMIIHNGNPYVSYILAIKSIINEQQLTLIISERMVAINYAIIKIINEVLKEFRIHTQINIERNIDFQQIKNKTKDTEVIILGNKDYDFLLKNKEVNFISYSPRLDIALYAQDDTFEELKESIIKYCDTYFINLEIYEAENIADLIEQLEADNMGELVIILTKEASAKEQMKKTKNIEYVINKNILTEIEERIIEKII